MKNLLVLASMVAFSSNTSADWLRFRGPNGSGIPKDGKAIPLKWSDTENVRWKTSLPGPGSSSPIVVGNKIFVTCWSGYGTDDSRDGQMEDLKRHLVCIDRKTGKILWDETVKAKMPEERYDGMFTQHGYATHTPASDGKAVYAFFGKSGLHAFDLAGKKLWEADAGDYLDRRGWGSASSPIVYQDKVIVTAAVEDEAVYAFNSKTGSQAWRSPASGLASTWSTPIAVSMNGRDSIVLAVPYEIWAYNPANGKLRWLSEAVASDSMCGSPIEKDGVIYAMGERGGGSVAIKAGGKGDVTKTHLAWEGKNGSRIGTPVFWDDRLYWIGSSIINCRDARTGEEIYAERVPGGASSASRSSGGDRGGRGGFGGGRGGFGGRGGADYSSPVAVNGHLYQTLSSGETLVLKMTKDFQFVGRNKIAKDGSKFSATSAIDNGQLFLRSNKNLYCIAD
jgi:outer membrane protein assembly factor BamB